MCLTREYPRSEFSHELSHGAFHAPHTSHANLYNFQLRKQNIVLTCKVNVQYAHVCHTFLVDSCNHHRDVSKQSRKILSRNSLEIIDFHANLRNVNI